MNTTYKKEQKHKKWRKRWKSIVQIIEKCYIQKNNGKLEKQNQCKTCKQQKRLIKMDFKTKLYVAQNI